MIVSSLSDGFSGEGDAANLLSALGSLWLAGAQPDWTALHMGERRQRISLPTYPFERKRYWLDAPAIEKSSRQLSAVPVAVSQTSHSRPTVMEELNQVKVIAQTPAPTVPVGNAPNRTARLRVMLAEIFEDLSGMDLSQADGSTTFLEMGFDSLFLTQVTQALQSKFGLKITFRQLLGDQGTLDALARYVASNLPANAFPEPDTVAETAQTVSSVAATITPAIAAPSDFGALPAAGNGETAMSESPLERLLREQLQAMNQLFAKQLEAVRVDSSAAAVAAPAPTIAAPAQTASVVVDKDAKELKGYTPFKALTKGPSAELTSRQQQYIAEFVARYTTRTAGSKEKTQEFRQVLADPRVVAGFRPEWKEMVYPIITVRSKGSLLWDVDGNEYVDILNGFGPIMLGHRPEFVERAIEKQLHEGFEIGPQTLLAGEVAKMICDFTGNERATFCNTGSEAVIAAMRVARTVTGRDKVVFFAGDYHGMFDEVLVKGFKRGGVPQSVPVAPGIPREKAANVIVLEYGTPNRSNGSARTRKSLRQ